MITLQEILRLSIKRGACKGNRRAFEKALNKDDALGCYQIAFGNRFWLENQDIIKDCDFPELEKLACGIGLLYHDNGKLRARINYKNGKFHGLREHWYDNGHLRYRESYKNGVCHGLYESGYDNGQLHVRVTYKNGQRQGFFEAWSREGVLRFLCEYRNDRKIR